MFLQYIQSHLDELTDISRVEVEDTLRLTTPVVNPTVEDVDFFWGSLQAAKDRLQESLKVNSKVGLVAGDIALNNIKGMTPGLKRFVSFYQEEDFYI